MPYGGAHALSASRTGHGRNMGTVRATPNRKGNA